MQAIILAAGMGKRLGNLTKNNTKCMVEVNGVPLIDRLLNQLVKLNLKRVVIVVGYEGQKLIDYIGDRYSNLMIEYVKNPIYDKTNNIYSLALAKKQMSEDDTLLIESDLIFDDKMFDLILQNPYPNLALVAKYESWMDGTMVRIDEDNNIVNFVPKKAFKYSEIDSYYKTVNIYKFSKEFSVNKYLPFLEAYCKALGNNEYYEQVLRVITYLDNADLKALPISDEKWYEIDDVQDLDIAECIFASEEDLLKRYYGRFGGFWRFPNMLDFCYLVNPYFPSKRMLDEMQSNFVTLLTQYPSGMRINSLIAGKCFGGVKSDYIIPGNGAAELIKVLMEYLEGKMGVVYPTFEEYPNRRQKDELEIFIPDNNDFHYTADDLMNYYDKHPISSLLLINPDNPSGNFIALPDVCRLAEWCKMKNVRLVLDESFVDFSSTYKTSTMLSNDLLEAYPHLIVIKSISKSYGVPGLRLGILASSDVELVKCIKKSVSIWNMNSYAEYFMQIFGKYEADYHKACEKFQKERTRFYNELKKIPFLRVIETEANYFLVEVISTYSSRELTARILKDSYVLLKDCSTKIGFNGRDYIRIAIRNTNDNDKLIKALINLIK